MNIYQSKKFSMKSLKILIFQKNLKFFSISPVNKKDNWHKKEIIRLVSVLLTFSSVYVQCLYNQIQDSIDNIVSNYQTGIWKWYKAQYSLIVMFEKCSNSVYAIYEPFQRIWYFRHDLIIIINLHEYRFDHAVNLQIIFNFLRRKKKLVLKSTPFTVLGKDFWVV